MSFFFFQFSNEGGENSQSPPKQVFSPPHTSSSRIEPVGEIMSRLSEDSGDSSPSHDPLGLGAPTSFVKSETVISTTDAAKREGIMILKSFSLKEYMYS